MAFPGQTLEEAIVGVNNSFAPFTWTIHFLILIYFVDSIAMNTGLTKVVFMSTVANIVVIPSILYHLHLLLTNLTYWNFLLLYQVTHIHHCWFFCLLTLHTRVVLLWPLSYFRSFSYFRPFLSYLTFIFLSIHASHPFILFFPSLHRSSRRLRLFSRFIGWFNFYLFLHRFKGKLIQVMFWLHVMIVTFEWW